LRGHSFRIAKRWRVEEDDPRIIDRSCAAIRAQQPPVRASAYWEMLKHPLQGEYWEARSMEAFVGEVRVPTMIVGGWQDQWEFSTGSQSACMACSKRTTRKSFSRTVGMLELEPQRDMSL
jgi:predicted acyl esterase